MSRIGVSHTTACVGRGDDIVLLTAILEHLRPLDSDFSLSSDGEGEDIIDNNWARHDDDLERKSDSVAKRERGSGFL